MGNLADIPEQYLKIEKKEQFMFWLSNQQIPIEEKIHLATIWKEFTGGKIYYQDIKF